MEIVQFVAESLGDSSYLIVSEGEAAVVDPQRDVRLFVTAANERGASITNVFETHAHNDYVSGGRELAALGATIVAPAGCGIEFPHEELGGGEELRIGAVRLRALDTPGHTPQHSAYLALDESGEIVAAFTGGSLIVGGAGRTDLLGPDHTEDLTRHQWESVQALDRALPAEAEVLPTHGAGSFCTTSDAGGDRRSVLRMERERNVALTSPDFEAFRAHHLGDLGPIPAYYRHMAPINRAGPAVHGAPPQPTALSPGDLAARMEAGLPAIDVRSRFAFAEGHIPGSWSVEESNSFLAFLSWVLPIDEEFALITEDAEQAVRVTADLFRIAYERVAGYLEAGAWSADRRPLAKLEIARAADLRGGAVQPPGPLVDVRFESDQQRQPIEGALALPFEHAAQEFGRVEAERPLLACASGSRAATVGSMLLASGRSPVVLIDGSAEDLPQPSPAR